MTERKKQGSISRLKQGWQRLSQEAEGAVRRLREGRMGSPYHTPYQVLGRPTSTDPLEIRRYRCKGPSTEAVERPLLVLLPPWPMTPEIFDIAPELSAIGWLVNTGIDVWTLSAAPHNATREGADEPTPPDEETLLLRLARSLADIHEETGKAIHLAGYSHSGHWVYQLAASAPDDVIASVVTFGVPAEGPGSIGQRGRSLAGSLISQVWRGLRGADPAPEQLPKTMGEYGVTLHEAHPHEETHHLFRLLGLLPKQPPPTDQAETKALVEDNEQGRTSDTSPAAEGADGPTRRPIRWWGRIGSWLGQRALGAGGDQKSFAQSVAPLTSPVLCFMGSHDTVVPPAQVRQIKALLPKTTVHELQVETGHFGLVVGPRAMAEVWPIIPQWMAWSQAPEGAPPFAEAAEQAAASRPTAASPTATGATTKPRPSEEKRKPQLPVQRLYDMATDLVDGLWNKLEEVSVDVGTMVEALRWQLPRMARLVSLTPDARVSLSLALAEQASALPHEVFFRWRGRTWTYKDVEEWVEGMAQHLSELGLRSHSRVALAFGNHPGLLLHLFALNRIGIAARILPPAESLECHIQWRDDIPFDILILDGFQHHQSPHAAPEVTSQTTPETHEPGDGDDSTAQADADEPDGDEPASSASQPTEGPKYWPDDLRCFHFPYPSTSLAELPALPLSPRPRTDWHTTRGAHIHWREGAADAVAMHMWTAGTCGPPKIVAVTNRHWGLAALGAAAAAGLTSADVVASTLPLQSSQGLLVAAGSAMLGGARLLLLDDHPTLLQQQITATDATVLFGGECSLARLSSFTTSRASRQIRAIVGPGLTPTIATSLQAHFPEASMLSSYSTTETNFALAHLRDDKPGALGRPLLGQASLAVVACDLDTKQILYEKTNGVDGLTKQPRQCKPDQPGLLLSKAPSERPFPFFEGYAVQPPGALSGLMTNVFAPGDQWFASDDLLRQDEDGDYWFVDRLSSAFRHPGLDEDVYPHATTQALLSLGFVGLATAGFSDTPPHTSKEPLMAAVELLPGHVFDGRIAYTTLARQVPASHLPWRIHLCPALPVTSSGTIHHDALHTWLQQPPGLATVYQRNDSTKQYKMVTS